MKKIKQPFLSPNTNGTQIDVQFLVLHYTGCYLEETISIFKNYQKKVSSHFIIDEQGVIYEVIPCLQQTAITAFHCGKSLWIDSNQRTWENLNQFSLGIELVNRNGNLFPYTDDQYDSLAFLTNELKFRYSALQSPSRVLGHEHIAGFRGKIDPGHQFEWTRYFQQSYPKHKLTDFPKRHPTLSLFIKERFQDFIQNLTKEEQKWSVLSHLLEQQQKHYLETSR